MRSNSIDRVMVSKTNPHNNNALWIDTSNGEKNAVLKYKGYPLVGGASGGGSGSGSDYQSSGSIVKDMIEQGSNFNWAKYAIDIPSLPCFKPEAEWSKAVEEQSLLAMLNDGYTALDDETGTPIEGGWTGMIVRITGDNPHVEKGKLVDCESVISVIPNELSALTPVRVIDYVQDGHAVGSISCSDVLWEMLRGTMAGNGISIVPVYEHPELPASLVSIFSYIG